MDLGRFAIAIVGGGPAGLSAAARAAALDDTGTGVSASHIVLEAFGLPAKTIQRYQKGKRVLAEPGYLQLRSDIRFEAAKREEILARWGDDISAKKINVRFNSNVVAIAGSAGSFSLTLASGDKLSAGSVVLALGLGGNPRRLNVPGEDHIRVQYQLDDPDEYRDERILVVGAGDAAIENALALCSRNQVTILNRGKEFSRAKDLNLRDLLAALNGPKRTMGALYQARVSRIQAGADPQASLSVSLETPEGEATQPFDRIIARLGSEPPRKFLEAAGIRFPNDRPDALPALSARYESNVPGMYIVGSLGGASLIKQAMNQGYDAVEYIHGHQIEPADHPLLACRFRGLPSTRSVQETLDRFKALIPVFRNVNALAFRELVIESDVIAAYPDGDAHADVQRQVREFCAADSSGQSALRVTRVVREGQVLYGPGDFSTSFFVIVRGEAYLESPESGRDTLEEGEFFGEISLLSGRPRAETAIAGAGCVLLEIPRRIMIKLMNSDDEIRARVDQAFVTHELQRYFAPQASLRRLALIASRLSTRRFKAGEAVVTEGQPGASLFLVRSGGVALFRGKLDEEIFVGRLQAGQSFGEMTVLGDPIRRETACAVVASEVLEIDSDAFRELAALGGAQIGVVQDGIANFTQDVASMAVRPEAGSVLAFLMREGLGEATNVLVIDETRCTGCDNCERACAETHGGISRLDRHSGASFARVHIPIACRHCEQPHCMKDCPPNAIRRADTGEVFIDDTCIGCGNCQSNCPYDVIRMSYQPPDKPGLLSWLLLGLGPGPGEIPEYKPTAASKNKGARATKCDACVGLPSGPACVQACPTGAARRIGPSAYAELATERSK
jgi:Fe-S-cluster-containing hydrogenase component 2/CRP-like cAMP-binding protein/thioredoxin reductase